MFKFMHDNKGSVTVIIAISLIVLLGAAALVYDGGYLFLRHTGLQDMADATALAAAMELTGNGNNEQTKKNKAFQAAKESVQRNGLTLGSAAYPEVDFTYGDQENGKMVISFPDGLKKAQVDMNITGQTFFAKVLGFNSIPVTVRAVAQVGQPTNQTGGIIPVSVVDDPNNPNDGDYTQWQLYEMTLGPGGGENGNYGWVDFGSADGVTGNTLAYYMRYGFPGAINIGDSVNSQTGVATGIAAHALGDRISGVSGTTQGCSETFDFSGMTTEQIRLEINGHLQAEPNCPRLVYVPIMSSLSSPVIQGFAAYFIESYQHDGNYITLRGVFINRLGEGEVLPGSPNYAVQSVCLVE